MNGFFEHKEAPGNTRKVPYHIKVAGEQLMFVAGIYQYAPHPLTGKAIGTFAIITRDANSLMREIHNSGPNKWRMPLILDYPDIRTWLNPKLTANEMKAILNYEFPSEMMDAWPIKQLKVEKENTAAILEKHDYPVMGSLF